MNILSDPMRKFDRQFGLPQFLNVMPDGNDPGEPDPDPDPDPDPPDA